MNSTDIIFGIIIALLILFYFGVIIFSAINNSYYTPSNTTLKIGAINYISTGLPFGTKEYVWLEGSLRTGEITIWHNYPVQGTIQLNQTCTFNMIGGTLKSYICK